MSLEDCKACRQQISKKAKLCPHCGHKAKRTGGCAKLLLAGFIIFALLFVTSLCTSKSAFESVGRGHSSIVEAQKNLEKEASEGVQRAFESGFIARTEKEVRQSFKDPESVKFQNVAFGSSERTGDVIYGQVNAKNGFGAYTGFVKFIANGKTTLTENKDKEFKEIWLMIQQARVTKDALKKLPKANSDVPFVIDVLSLAGKSPSQVAEILGVPDEEQKTKSGDKKIYKGGEIDIVFINGKADWIAVNQLEGIEYSPSALSAFGLDAKDPVFATTDIVIRWKDINGLKSVSVFKGKDEFCDYLYVKAYTK